jgi:lipopolysaccharide transport system ATP-binding protein
MNNTILKIENLSKQYRLGLVGTGTMGDDLKRWWANVRGKEDPFLKIGDVNNRATKGSSDYVWALKDINFEVQQGEVLGIIGKNGAGKSTLLKILSKITSPTTGSIKSKGRVASLLEVGTGFHGEMTGRENIFLNGAILGMTKKEITDKLDEIIEFSGCERYIDTPVKRYSSGMTVRLAFAVAAFLEPDILIIDEVLAVGDAEFQKKAIGKMQDISRTGGRTVLFVSHNMAAVKQLCTRGIVLENGKVVFEGGIEESVGFYHNVSSNFDSFYKRNNSKEFSEIVIDEITIKNELGNLESHFHYDQNIIIDFKLDSKFEIKNNNRYNLFCTVVNKNGDRVCSFETDLLKSNYIKLAIDAEFLVRGEYFINAFIHVPKQSRIDEVDEVCLFEIIDDKSKLSKHGQYNYGQVFGRGEWKYLP